ncbi:hypothetical protein NPIL_435041 [Nephila pilipes]|uniref:Uncharacterized protein n=1 Tax=Nephila pilipes TaxID=299642 RepID=A0A8X6QNT0_NEPPI|nr:hypothetical protein NPIL_435041 [Nephila pilipes]
MDITDPKDFETDNDEEEAETMDTNDQDRNNEACLIRTRMKENYKEAAEKFYRYQKRIISIPFSCNTKEYNEEKERIRIELNKYLALK